MSDALPTHLDRATAALASHGVRLRRSKVLELLSTLLGHRSSNELVAAADRGDLDPPKAVMRPETLPGQDGTEGLVSLLDPVTNRWFGVDRGMLEATDRASNHLFSPWGNLLDVRPAKRALTERDGPRTGDGLVPRTGLTPIDLPRLIAEADRTGREWLDVRSDGTTGRVTSGRPGEPDTVLHEGDALPVDALLQRIRDDRMEWEHGPHKVNVLGVRLDVEGMSRMDRDHVRFALKAGRDRNLRIAHVVHFSWPQMYLIRSARAHRVADDDHPASHVSGELAKLALGVVPEREVAGIALDDVGDSRLESVYLDPETDEAVSRIRKRLGASRSDVIRFLVVTGARSSLRAATAA